MNNETISNTENSNKQFFCIEQIAAEEIKTLKTENTKLKGEVSLLRQNMLTLEKSNYNLRLEKSELSKKQLLDKKNSELELLKIQYKINENRPNSYKRSHNSNFIDIKWALKHSNSTLNFNLEPFEYERLKFFKDYFFHDFCQFDTKIILNYISQFSKEKYKKFLDFYILFACKIDIFSTFFHLIFINDHFIDLKLSLLNEVPLDWIINCKNGEYILLVKEFIKKHTENIILFMHRILSERPFITNLLIDVKTLTKMLQTDDYKVRFLKDELCKNMNLKLVNKHNLHLFNKEQLKIAYKDEYMDIL